MANYGPQIRVPGLIAGEDLTAAQHHFVCLVDSTDNVVDLCDAVTDKPIGVLQNAPDSGEEATVCAIGITKVVAHAAIDTSDSIGTAEDGRADIYTAADTTKYIVGQALTDAANAGEVITAAINCVNSRTLA